MAADQTVIEGARPEKILAARPGTAPGWASGILRVLPLALTALLFIWFLVVTGLGLQLVAQILSGPHLDYTSPDIATPQILASAGLVYLLCLAVAVATRWRRPEATVPVTLGTGAVVVFAGATATGSLRSLLVTLVCGLLAGLLGYLILARLPRATVPATVLAPLSLALGLGVLGLLSFALAIAGVLTAPVVVLSVGLVIVGLFAVQRHHIDTSRLRTWQYEPLSWFETLVVALATGFVSFAILMAFVPETISDAVWQHLAIVREIWQTSSIGEFSGLEVSRDPIQGHLMYAVAYGFGGPTSVTLLHTMIGLGAIAGVASLCWLLAGRAAVAVGTALFATIPMTMWLMGHGLIDFFTIVYLVASLLALLLWQRSGDRWWPIVAGAMAGFGLAAKLNMLPLIAILGLGILLIGREGSGWRERILAGIAFGCGALVALPWIVRSYQLNGTLSPKIQVVVNSLSALLGNRASTPQSVGTAPVTDAMQVYDPQAFSLGHSPLDLLRIPWFITFHADAHRFLVIGRGEIGVLILLLLPLIFLTPRSRGFALVAIVTLLSYVSWVFTPFQIVRHLLPTLALAAVLAGAGIAGAFSMQVVRKRQILRWTLQSGIALGLLAAPVFFLFGVLTRFPVDLFLGRETAAAYVARAVPAAAALEAASALPPDTPIAYFGRQDGGAQAYTEARLIYVEPNNTLASLGSTPQDVLSSLSSLGVDHFIWNRSATTAADWRATVLSTEFLRDHTRILAGDRNAYFFEVLPQTGNAWKVQSKANLLEDPGFKKVKRTNGPWTATGTVRGKDGFVSVPVRSLVAQRVPVTGGQTYLLVASSRCPGDAGGVDLAFRWLGGDGQELGTDSEAVVPGAVGSRQFLWHRAPAAATDVSVELATHKGSKACEFNDARLYAQN